MVPGPGKELVGVFLLLLAFREMWMVNCLAFKYCVGELVKQVFTCTDRGISELKEAVSDIPTHVRVLNVSVNKIRTLHHRGLENLTQLELLRLDKNNLTTIDIEAFWKLSNLQLLNLSCNQLETLKPGIFKFLPNLTNLILKQNKLTSFLGESVFALKRLRVLDISSNSLRNVSSFFKALSSCTGLRTLNAENNNISALEISSYFPPNLTHLLLARNVISQLWAPAAFFANIIYLDLSFNNLSSSKELTSHTFTRLQFLNVQHNPLGKDGVIDIVQNLNAPLVNINLSNLTLNDKATLGKLCKFIQKKRIQRLELRGNRLHQVSSAFSNCQDVVSLDLSHNQIIKPNIFGSLDTPNNLQVLNLDFNLIRNVSLCGSGQNVEENRSSPCLEKLQHLTLRSNRISAIRSHVFQNLKNLRYLSLALNEINFINITAFVGLTNLNMLSLTNNAIEEIFHETFTNLTNLQSLKLRNNRIPTVFNKTYSSLSNLIILDLGGNHIHKIENGGFKGLKALEKLYLDRNWLSNVSQGMFEDLKSLRVLDLANNKLSFGANHLKFPPFIHLQNLQMLKLRSQAPFGLRLLPHNLFHGLQGLKRLDISNNKFVNLNTLPFQQLTNLEQLHMSDICNGFQTMHDLTFANLINLRHLTLKNVGLESIRKILFQNLTSLNSLMLSSNMIHVIKEIDIPPLHNLTYLDLRFNPISCVCDNIWFQQWATSSDVQVPFFYQYPCVDNGVEKRTYFAKFDSSVCNDGFVAFCATAPVIFVLMVTVVVYQKGKWSFHYGYYLLRAWIHENKLQKNSTKGYKFDAFVSYNSKDEAWVFDQLMNNLENEGPPFHQLCFHHRDFEVGKPIVENIVDAIYKSRKTICIISKNYLQSEWCSMEMQVALYRLFDEHSDVLILVFLEEIPGHVLSSYHHLRKLVRKKTYINWPADESGQKLFWTKLRDALKKVHTASDESIPQLTHCTI
ncbi:toll-like receptor 13 isoform X1 [Rhincodon typus]|uniref:toll-like receptor 13 isoform X1 n=1 Tax=Rhincodon typus TaxID=259920 RepID=UPI0009A29BC3|nr:toll-like receptor 13 isoform X1 [Rhincodon typus]